MFLLTFKTSFYSGIFTATKLVTNFSSLNCGFRFLSLSKILLNFVEVFVLDGYSDVLNKFPAVIYSLCFKKQILELWLYFCFKVEIPTNGLQDISLLVLKSIQTWKYCCDAIRSSTVSTTKRLLSFISV